MIEESYNKKAESEQQEKYSPGYDSSLVSHFQTRTIHKEAGFFTPHLRQGMTLLDCGCGPGTITLGFANLLKPGHIQAIDIEATQIEIAKSQAYDNKIDNITFHTGSVYQLPFDDNTFDAVFAHAVLQHLKNPAEALKEMHRVLKPNGIIGVRDDDLGGLIITPSDPLVEKLIMLIEKVMEYHGGNHRVGRLHRALLRKAGFKNTEASASCEYDGKLETTRKRASIAIRAAETFVADTAIKMNWATSAELKCMADACRAWGENPDAFDTTVWCETLAWK